MVLTQLSLLFSLCTAVLAAPHAYQAASTGSRDFTGHHLSKRTTENEQVYIDVGNCNYGQGSELDDLQKSVILSYHNWARRSVLSTNMNMLSWDDDLACWAQKVADECRWGHDGVRPGPGQAMVIGQNIIAYYYDKALTYLSVDKLVEDMTYFFEESENYNYPDFNCLSTGECNHYRMMMMYKQTRMGAACSLCDQEWTNDTGTIDLTNVSKQAVFCVFNFEYPLSQINGVAPWGLWTPESGTCSECQFSYARCNEGLCEECESMDSHADCFVGDCADQVPEEYGLCQMYKQMNYCQYYGSYCKKTCELCH